MSSASENPETERATASFIFLPDMRSSAFKLLSEIEQATQPRTLANILERARYVMCNLPFHDYPKTANTSQGAFHNPALASCWFLIDNPIGADETATEIQWECLSFCINFIKTAVCREAEKVGRENVFLVGVGIGFAVATAFLLQMEEPIGGLLGVYPVMPFHVDLKYIALDGQTKAVVNSWSDMERKKSEEEKGKGKEKMEESLPHENEAKSEASTVTLNVNHGDDQTHESRRARVMGFFQYLATHGKPPAYKRFCDRLDASTPVVMLHGMDDERIPFKYGKEAVQTFENLGYNAKLDIKEGEGHRLSRNMIGELFHNFVKQELGSQEVRKRFIELLQKGAFEGP
ncbi:hypothetical protein GGI35DRAFT_491332 [Trichoderma velutinum]